MHLNNNRNKLLFYPILISFIIEYVNYRDILMKSKQNKYLQKFPLKLY